MISFSPPKEGSCESRPSSRRSAPIRVLSMRWRAELPVTVTSSSLFSAMESAGSAAKLTATAAVINIVDIIVSFNIRNTVSDCKVTIFFAKEGGNFVVSD